MLVRKEGDEGQTWIGAARHTMHDAAGRIVCPGTGSRRPVVTLSRAAFSFVGSLAELLLLPCAAAQLSLLPRKFFAAASQPHWCGHPRGRARLPY